MTTLTMQKVVQKRRNDPHRNPSNTNINQTENDPTKKEDSKVLIHIGNTTSAPTEDETTNNDIGTNNKEVNSTEPSEPNGQAYLALAYNDNTLMAKEAWDLINKDHLDDNGLNTDDNDMDDSKQAYGRD